MAKKENVSFGGWLKSCLKTHDIKAQRLSVESGLMYANLSRMINDGSKGKVATPDFESVEMIGKALQRLGAIEDYSEAIIAAGYVPADDSSQPSVVSPQESGESQGEKEP